MPVELPISVDTTSGNLIKKASRLCNLLAFVYLFFIGKTINLHEGQIPRNGYYLRVHPALIVVANYCYRLKCFEINSHVIWQRRQEDYQPIELT